MKTLGNISLLGSRKIGYFASSKIASLSVLPTLDWAMEVAKRDDVAIVSGFHSKMEREVLDILLRGRCGIICVLARPIYKVIPDKYRDAFAQDRVLFISHNTAKSTMTSRNLCHQRNEYIASISDELVFSSLSPESSLYSISLRHGQILLL
ncbi:MAG: hypothetical protein K2M88_06820 [Muribaculaceae bacterium]|nr:hypothetical protein [Muribaculaceae bacterium]